MYPDLHLACTLRVRPEGRSFRILVDLETPLPEEWVGRVGFNFELFPGILFGKTWALDGDAGIFPRQPGGPGVLDEDGEYQIAVMGRGMRLVVAPESPLVNDAAFTSAVAEAVKGYRAKVDELEKKTPYGVPYEPNIWGAGWNIQSFGMQQYFLHNAFPEVFPRDLMLHALDFVLGCHPGPSTSSFVSGVGSRSVLVGYGLNRADWSYEPGGIVSGTALIRPDSPELHEWPFLWQQTEYVLGGGTTDDLILALAADHLLGED